MLPLSVDYRCNAPSVQISPNVQHLHLSHPDLTNHPRNNPKNLTAASWDCLALLAWHRPRLDHLGLDSGPSPSSVSQDERGVYDSGPSFRQQTTVTAAHAAGGVASRGRKPSPSVSLSRCVIDVLRVRAYSDVVPLRYPLSGTLARRLADRLRLHRSLIPQHWTVHPTWSRLILFSVCSHSSLDTDSASAPRAPRPRLPVLLHPLLRYCQSRLDQARPPDQKRCDQRVLV
jgi:hypothetical protein